MEQKKTAKTLNIIKIQRNKKVCIAIP